MRRAGSGGSSVARKGWSSSLKRLCYLSVGLVLILLSATVFLLTKATRAYVFGPLFEWVPATVTIDYINIEAIKEIRLAFQLACADTWVAGRRWAWLLFLLGEPLWRGLWRLAVLSRPHVVRGWLMFIQQDPRNLLLEALCLLVLVCAVLLQRFIVRRRYLPRARAAYTSWKQRLGHRWSAFLEQVRHKSRLLAACLPHLLFWAPAGALVWWFPEPLAWLGTGWPLFLIVYVTPMLMTLASLSNTVSSDSDAPESPSKLSLVNNLPGPRSCLMYWVIVALLLCLTEALQYLPVSPYLLSFAPIKEEGAFLFFCWLLIPFTDGVAIFYRLVVPLLSKYIKKLPDPGSNVESGKLNFAFRAAVTMRLLTQHQAEGLLDSLARSAWALAASLSLLGPSTFSSAGAIAAGLLFPAFHSITSLSYQETPALASRERVYLRYWICAIGIWLAHAVASEVFGWIPFWYHVKLLIFLWLQLPLPLPFFPGAEFVLTSVGNFLSVNWEKARNQHQQQQQQQPSVNEPVQQ